MPAMTLLSIDDIDFSDWSVRAITMTLRPIEAAKQLRRDCRGILVDVSLPQFQRYEATISCTDHEAPELTGVWPGRVVTVTCIPELGVYDASDGTITMVMMVRHWETSREDWEAQTAWSLELEEVGEVASA